MNDGHPREEFGGVVRRTVETSEPWWPARTRPAATAPNVVVVVLDDVGFAQIGPYGSSIETPAIDALAAGGIRYSNFHVTALCSPTRACLLTGRNHHTVGMGFLADFDTGFPAYRGAVGLEAATLGELLGRGGYGTYAAGKWHLVPPGELSPIGPFRHWPTQRGFDRYYGFLWGEDDQWTPELWEDQHRVDPPRDPDYHLSEDLVSRSIRYVGDHVSLAPDRPFLLYLAFGACHAPHQAPRAYGDRYRGRFDHGWDEERLRVLQRQIETGLVPPDTALAPRNPGVVPWSELSADERRLAARMQEVFAGFMTHTDAQIGRLVEFLRSHSLLDDTLLLVLSDNGASGEGGSHGTANEYRYFLGLEDSFADSLARIDDLGGPAAHNHYPMGWAQAGNTPLKFYKKHTFGGGVRAPLIVHWPARLRERGVVRHEFFHAIDVVPTLLDAAGLDAPASHRGVEQLPLHGVSMLDNLERAAPSAHGRQYFETAGHRGIVRDGMKVVTYHEPGTSFDDDVWELYDLRRDFSETHDLAADRPELVTELVEEWWCEAERYGVLPLDDRMQARVETLDPSTQRLRWELLPGARAPNGVVGPNFSRRLFSIRAEVERASDDDDGVLLAFGRRAAGFVFFVEDGRLVLDYNLAGDHTLVEAATRLPLGPSTAELRLERDGGEDGQVVARLLVDGARVASGALPSTMPGGLGCLSTQCGHNAPSPVSGRYEPPNAFRGTLHRVVVELEPTAASFDQADWDAAIAQE